MYLYILLQISVSKDQKYVALIIVYVQHNDKWIAFTNASTLMSALNVSNWDPINITKTRYPDPSEMNWVIARLEWGLPHPDGRVEYELWTSANDPQTVKFKQNWRNTALNLEYKNYTTFAPHVYTINGSYWRCDTGTFRCGKQCTNSGRYCAVDPEGVFFKNILILITCDVSSGLNGMDVVQENLRSTCVWKLRESLLSLYSQTHNESYWWDYVNLWNSNCWQTNNTVETFTANCSYQQMNALVDNQSLSLWVQQCVTDSGGYDYVGGSNTILDEELSLQSSSGTTFFFFANY
ncbi:hypothetical protein RFI_05274, partial [Reticulomyxa filosa]